MTTINLVDRCCKDMDESSTFEEVAAALGEVRKLCIYASCKTDNRNQMIAMFPCCTLNHFSICSTLQLLGRTHVTVTENVVYLQLVASILQYKGNLSEWQCQVKESGDVYFVKCRNGLIVRVCDECAILPSAYIQLGQRVSRKKKA